MANSSLQQHVVVIALITDAQGRVLLQQRNDASIPDAHGKWELPGGMVDAGESPEQALKRECEEELGIRISVHGLVPLSQSHTWRMADGSEVATFVVCYKARILEGVPKASDAEVGAVRWYSKEELARVDFLLGVYDFIKAA